MYGGGTMFRSAGSLQRRLPGVRWVSLPARMRVPRRMGVLLPQGQNVSQRRSVYRLHQRQRQTCVQVRMSATVHRKWNLLWTRYDVSGVKIRQKPQKSCFKLHVNGLKYLKIRSLGCKTLDSTLAFCWQCWK